MKSVTLFLLCLLWCIATSGQEVKQDLLEVRVSPPQFRADSVHTESIHQYIADNFQYPTEQRGLCLGTSIISFTVKADGVIDNFNVVNSVSEPVDEELIRVLEATEGLWKPGTNNGNPVDMKIEFMIMIKTGVPEYASDRYDFNEMAKLAYIHGNQLLMKKNKPRRALRHLIKGIRLLPRDQSLLLVRGLCYSELGKSEEAQQDWERLRELGGIEIDSAEPISVKEVNE